MTFRAINWTPNEMVGEAKMDQMTDNAEWLFRNTPRAIYTLPGGLRREQGIRMASGRILIPKNTKRDSGVATVRFGNFYTIGCEPIVTTGIVAEHQTKIHCVINGLGKLQPDYRGFNVHVNIAASAKKKDKILRSFYVSWQSMGY